MADNEDDEEFGEFLQGPTPQIGTPEKDQKSPPALFQNATENRSVDHDIQISDDEQAICPSGMSTSSLGSLNRSTATHNTVQTTSVHVSSAAGQQGSGQMALHEHISTWVPKWWEHTVDQLSSVYEHVLEATLVDGEISTERLRPILAASGLTRERLAQIWSMCNVRIPGQLVRQELWAVLALIGLTQNNYPTCTIDDLARCWAVPVPKFMHIQEDIKKESQLLGNSNAPFFQLADSDVCSTQIVDPVNSDVLPTQLADVLSTQLIEPVNIDVSSTKRVTSVSSDVLSPQRVIEPCNFDALFTQRVDLMKADEPLIRLFDLVNSDVMLPVDPVNSDVLLSQIIDPVYFDVLLSQIVDPVISDVLSPQLVDLTISDVLSPQLADPVISDVLSPQVDEPVISDVLSPQLVKPVISDVLSPQLVDLVISDVLSPQLVEPNISDVLSPQLADPVISDVLSPQLVDLTISDVLSPQLADPVISDVLSPQLVDPVISDVLSPQLVDPVLSDVLSPQLVDLTISDVLSPQVVEPVISDVLSTQLVKPVISDVLSSQLVDLVISDVLSPQLVEPNISDVLSPQLADPVISDVLSPQLVDLTISDVLSPQLVDLTISDVLSPQLVDLTISDVLSPQLADPVISDVLSPQLVDLTISDVLSPQLADPVISDVLSPQLVDLTISDVLSPQVVEPVIFDVLSPQLVEPVISDVLSPQLVDLVISDVLSPQLVKPNNSNEPFIQLLGPENTDVTSTQPVDRVDLHSQFKFTTALTNWATASYQESETTKTQNILDTKSVFDNSGVSDSENDADCSAISDKCIPLAGHCPRMPDLSSQYWLDIREEGADRCSHEWERCLRCCWQVISEANAFLGSIASSAICTEVLKSAQGLQYVSGLLEIYGMICRVATSMRSTAISTTELEQTLKDIDIVWNNLTAFLAGASLLTKQDSLVFTHCMPEQDLEDSQNLACGVCLLSVDPAPFSTSCCGDTNSGKLTYCGRPYHATCANFWVNCVGQTLPALRLSNLL